MLISRMHILPKQISIAFKAINFYLSMTASIKNGKRYISLLAVKFDKDLLKNTINILFCNSNESKTVVVMSGITVFYKCIPLFF